MGCSSSLLAGSLQSVVEGIITISPLPHLTLLLFCAQSCYRWNPREKRKGSRKVSTWPMLLLPCSLCVPEIQYFLSWEPSGSFEEIISLKFSPEIPSITANSFLHLPPVIPPPSSWWSPFATPGGSWTEPKQPHTRNLSHLTHL